MRRFLHIIFSIFINLRFPFLKPYHHSKGKTVWTDSWFYMIPDGWRRAFGYKLCREIEKVLVKENMKNYTIYDIKEKYGELRWYDNSNSKAINDIITKYTNISKNTCIICGDEESVCCEEKNYPTIPLCVKCNEKRKKFFSETRG